LVGVHLVGWSAHTYNRFYSVRVKGKLPVGQ
jgi:hypothetical protein